MFHVRSKWNYFAATLMGGALFAGTLLAQGKPTTLTGTVTDAMCGAKHTMMKDTPDKKCTLECVKMGSKYGLIVGDKVYDLDGKEGDLEKFAGAKAKVSGTLDGNTVKVKSVTAG